MAPPTNAQIAACIRKGTGSPHTTQKYKCRFTKGCDGTCPLKVIVHKATIGERATCKECGGEYQVPSWAKPLLPKGARTFPKPAVRANPSKEAKLEQQNAELRRQLKAALKGGEAEPVEPKPKASLGDLQALLDQAKKVGDEAMVDLAQKRLDDAKKTDKVVGNPLTVIFAKIDKAQKQTDKLTSDIVQTRDKTR